MSDTIDKFAEDCEAAGIRPSDVLEAVGLHRSTWFRWRQKKVSPGLRRFEEARQKLDEMRAERSRVAAGAMQSPRAA